MRLSSAHRHPASYRDPSGYMFWHSGILYRQVNDCFREDFKTFMESGLYNHLAEKNLLVRHDTVNENLTGDTAWHTTLKPEVLPFISYPYEWSFDMLKDAALLTLQLAQEAMNYNMMLKDASPYNIQLRNGKLIFIDTLSFEKWDSTKPWIAYRQFCENFLAPLSLMHYTQLPLHPLMLSFPDGIPIRYAKNLLPWKSKLNGHLYLHVHLQSRYAGGSESGTKTTPFSPQKLKNILKSLLSVVQSFHLDYKGTWADYYDEAELRGDYLACKKRIVENWINGESFERAIDAGANDGSFSRMLASKNIFTISADSDHFAVNKLYLDIKEKSMQNLAPLLVDFANPSPATGLNNRERQDLFSRTRTDLVLALAVIHHLAIGKNIRFEDIAVMFSNLGKKLIIEFVPKEDPKVTVMLQQKRDSYGWYNETMFKEVFSRHYKLIATEAVAASGRTIYLMEPHEK